jgi:hypothetical protein
MHLETCQTTIVSDFRWCYAEYFLFWEFTQCIHCYQNHVTKIYFLNSKWPAIKLEFISQDTTTFYNRQLPYLRVYKTHFFDKNLPSEIGVRLFTESLKKKKNLDPPRKGHYHIED